MALVLIGYETIRPSLLESRMGWFDGSTSGSLKVLTLRFKRCHVNELPYILTVGATEPSVSIKSLTFRAQGVGKPETVRPRYF